MATILPPETLEDRRLHMVNGQLRTGGVVDLGVLAAFLETPRHRFVARPFASLAYLDRDLPALGAKSRRLLPPLTLARMLQAAGVRPGERVLDVGGGSGYGTALLAHMGAKVVALETDSGAAAAARTELSGRADVSVIEGPLEAGVGDLAPFDVILVEGAFQAPPKALIGQLADKGRLVGVDSTTAPSQAAVFERVEGAVSRRALFETSAQILDGFQARVSFAF